MTQEDSHQHRSSRSSHHMSFIDHLEELRVRVMRSLVVFMIGFVAAYFVSEDVMDFLRKPLFAALPLEKQKLYFTSLFENFLTHLKIAGYTSIAAVSPYIFWEIWSFVSPGLLPRERKMAVPFITATSVFFVGGALFAYFVLFPVGFRYFVTYGGPADVPLLTIDSYYNTCLKLMLLFGLAFELPVIICLLGALGIVDAPMLRSQRRTAILLITVISAVFAPPDAMSMIILGVPLVLLYEGAIWVVQWMGAKRSLGENEQIDNPLEGRSRDL